MKKSKKIGEAPAFIPLKFVKAGEVKSDDEGDEPCFSSSGRFSVQTQSERNLNPISVVDGHDFVLHQLQVDEEFSDSEIELPTRRQKKKRQHLEKPSVPASHRLRIDFRGKGKPEAYQISELHPDIISVSLPRGTRHCVVTFPSEEAAKQAYYVLRTKKLNGCWLRVNHLQKKDDGYLKLIKNSINLNKGVKTVKKAQSKLRKLRREGNKKLLESKQTCQS